MTFQIETAPARPVCFAEANVKATQDRPINSSFAVIYGAPGSESKTRGSCPRAVRFTECVAVEVAPYGIQVYALNPGLVRTAMTEYLLRQPRVAEYAPWFPPAMAQDAQVPPDDAGRLAVFLAAVRDARLSGRAFSIGSDYARLSAEADPIERDDLYVLRVQMTRAKNFAGRMGRLRNRVEAPDPGPSL